VNRMNECGEAHDDRTVASAAVLSCADRVATLCDDGVITFDQKEVLKEQLAVNNTEVLRELCVSSDDSVRNLAGDLLYHRNVFDAIDGGSNRHLACIEGPDSVVASTKSPYNESDGMVTLESGYNRPLSFRRFSVLEYQNCEEVYTRMNDIDSESSPSILSKRQQARFTALRRANSGLTSSAMWNTKRCISTLRSQSKRKLESHMLRRVNVRNSARKASRSVDDDLSARNNLNKIHRSPSAPPDIDQYVSFLHLNQSQPTDKGNVLRSFDMDVAQDCRGDTWAESSSLVKNDIESLDDSMVVCDLLPSTTRKDNTNEPGVIFDDCSQLDDIHGSATLNSATPFPALWQIFSYGGFENLRSDDVNGLLYFSTDRGACDDVECAGEQFSYCVTDALHEKLVQKSRHTKTKSYSAVDTSTHVYSAENSCDLAPRTESHGVKELISRFNGNIFDSKESQNGSCGENCANEIVKASAMSTDRTHVDLSEAKISQRNSMKNPLLDNNYSHEKVVSSCKNSLLSRPFGNVASVSVQHTRSKFYMKDIKPLRKSLQSNMSKSSPRKRLPKSCMSVRFEKVEIKFYPYTIGQGVPSDGGPSIGLDWDSGSIEALEFDIDLFENFRGGIIPEDITEDEEWDDNWRLPREYFLEGGGHIEVEQRIFHLRAAGHRRCSIDFSSFICRQVIYTI